MRNLEDMEAQVRFIVAQDLVTWSDFKPLEIENLWKWLAFFCGINFDDWQEISKKLYYKLLF